MASSILTNASALSALQNLSVTERALSAAQSQVASGLRVASASDNAAYWSIASTMRSDTGALSAVSDALDLGASVVETAGAAVASTLTLLGRIKADLVAARQPGTSLAAVQSDIAARQKSLASILSSASFNGVNLLDGSAGTSALAEVDDEDDDDDEDGVAASPAFIERPVGPIRPVGPPIVVGPVVADEITIDRTLSFVVSFSRGAAGAAALGTATLNTAKTNLVGFGGVLNGVPGGAGSTNILGMDVTVAGFSLGAAAADLDAAIASVTAAGALIGGLGTTIANQKTYVSSLQGALVSGLGALVDADMNAASTRLQALQTQRQLGIQALSIANGDGRLVLELFRAA